MSDDCITPEISLALRVIALLGPVVETRTDEAKNLNINPQMFQGAMRLGLVMHDPNGYLNSKSYSLTISGEEVVKQRGWDNFGQAELSPDCPHNERFKRWVCGT